MLSDIRKSGKGGNSTKRRLSLSLNKLPRVTGRLEYSGRIPSSLGPELLLEAESDPDDEQESDSRRRADEIHGGPVRFRALVLPTEGIQEDTGGDGTQEVAEACYEFHVSDPLVDLVGSDDLTDDARLQAEVSTRTQSAPECESDDPAGIRSVRPDEEVWQKDAQVGDTPRLQILTRSDDNSAR